MSDPNQVVTVVNRTSKMLQGTYNGRPYDLPPGESRYSRLEARYFQYQNPVMGRGTPFEDWSTKSEYLIGIKEAGDDCSPIEQNASPQRWDTSMLSGPNTEVIRPRGGGYAPEVRQPQAPMAHGDGGFVKP